MKKRKVLLSAYTLYNVGDDLFIKVICERYKNINFYLVAPKGYRQLFEDVCNLYIIPNNSIIFRILNRLSSLIFGPNSLMYALINWMDIFIIIGGSLFIENNDWKSRFELGLPLNCPNKKIFLLGSNFGPYNTDEFYNTFKNIFNTFEDICFREEYSYHLFSNLHNVRFASDIVFNLPDSSYESLNQISISVINLRNRKDLVVYESDYINKILEICVYFQENDVLVNLISFCTYEGDDEVVNIINSKLVSMSKSKCNVVLYSDNLNIILDTLKKSKLIIATRFHAMILGWKFKKNVVPILYSEKMSNVIRDSNFKGYVGDIKNMAKLDVQHIFEEYLSNRSFDICDLELDAENQFLKLDEYLNDSL